VLEGLKITAADVLNAREEQHRRAGRKLWTYYPDEGPLRRELYEKHLSFFEAGITHRERAAMAGNRVGKSEGIGAYEVALHLTGLYPDWWKGRRFTQPVNFLCGGDTNTTTRDIIVAKLLGPQEARGTGMIPRDCLERVAPAPGVPGHVDYAKVKHVSGKQSTVQFRSYDQGREAWQGTERDGIWMDEEPPQAIYTEALLRTMTTKGIVLCTFTPLNGLTDVALSFMNPEGQKWVVGIDWNDVPHLSQQDKDELWASIPPHQRDARAKGIPALGSGVIFPVSEDAYVVPAFEIPSHWPRAMALDVGWNRTAAVWGAWNRENDTVYIYDEYYGAESPPQVHAEAIKARGQWIPGVIDPASRGRSQIDGRALADEYMSMGLNLTMANNEVEAGLFSVYRRLSSGRLKVFSHLNNWLGEVRLYRRDEKGKVVKERDHLMDTTRYLIMSGMARSTVEPIEFPEDQNRFTRSSASTGY
jgi:phage terminase large subunit-like protein